MIALSNVVCKRHKLIPAQIKHPVFGWVRFVNFPDKAAPIYQSYRCLRGCEWEHDLETYVESVVSTITLEAPIWIEQLLTKPIIAPSYYSYSHASALNLDPILTNGPGSQEDILDLLQKKHKEKQQENQRKALDKKGCRGWRKPYHV